MTGVEELRAAAAVVLAVTLPIAFILLAILNTTREHPSEVSGQAVDGGTAGGRMVAGRIFAWSGGLTLASTAVLLLLA